MPKRAQSIAVRLPQRSYRIHVESGALHRIGEILATHKLDRRVVVVSDAPVAALYAKPVLRSLRGARTRPVLISLPTGEKHKTMRTVSRVYDHLCALAVDRETVLVALGGGVVGDLAGFVAATYLRGIDLVHVPTTVLAQVDSSIGGKTGVDLPEGKNLVGAFYQPKLVLTDPSVTATLPSRQVRAGYAEIVKVAMALDARLFADLERDADALRAGDLARYTRVVVRAARNKVGVVIEDERDRGRRRLLNYGHTIGHALESEGRYRRWLHGEAVSLGMAAAADIAVRRGLLAESSRERQNRLLAAFGLPLALSRISAQRVVSRLALDKKAKDGRPAFVLTRRVGVASVHRTVTRNDAILALRQLGAQA